MRRTAMVDEMKRTILTTTEAAHYLGYKTGSALRKAHLEGRITPAGRRGGTGTWMWSLTELDRFACGASVTAERSDTARNGDVNE